jgi:hypothetical protein
MANSGAPDAGVEPALETGAPPPAAPEENAEAHRTIGSTTISRSFSRSQSTTLESGTFLVGSLRTLASTGYFTAGRLWLDWHEKTLLGAGEQPIDHTLVRRCRSPFESVLAAIDTFDVELLTGFDPVLLPDLSRQDDLAS